MALNTTKSITHTDTDIEDGPSPNPDAADRVRAESEKRTKDDKAEAKRIAAEYKEDAKVDAEALKRAIAAHEAEAEQKADELENPEEKEAFVPNDIPVEVEAQTVAEVEQVDIDLGVDAKNQSDERKEWLEAVKNSPTVRDDGMTKSPTAPDDGILKSPPEKRAADVKAMVERDVKAAHDQTIPSGFDGEYIGSKEKSDG